MIKHIVMWKFKAEVSKADKLEMKRQLEALKGVVPSLIDIEIGLNIAAGDAAKDMVLYSTFATASDLKAYANHPAHVKVGERLKLLVSERAVVDYEA